MPLIISKKHDLRMNLSLSRYLFGKRGLFGTPAVDVDQQGSTGIVSMQEAVSLNDELLTGISDQFTDERPYVANDDEWKDRIPRRGRKKWERWLKRIRLGLVVLGKLRDKSLPLSARLDMLRMGRELTPTEMNDLIENEERRRLYEFHRERARRGQRQLIETLARLGYCNKTVNQDNGHETIKNKIRFDRVEVGPLVYRYHVDAKHLPWKVSIQDLYQDGVCTTLSASVEHPVRAEIQQIESFVTGLIYTIEIAATLGIPNLCKFSDLLPLIPQSAPALAFLVGYGENKRPYWRSLEDMPHFLGGGQTAGGKSNMSHVMLCTFIARNTPDDLKLILVDMKFNGIELDRYRGIPHLITEIEGVEGGIAGTPAEAIKVLTWARDEGNRRGVMFKNEGTQNLKAWNKKHKTRKLPAIIIAMDELALLRLDPADGNKAYDLIREISSTARAAGIHLVAWTQSSNKRVIDEMIKVNFPGRICFSVPDASSSVLFVGDGSAIDLMPAGRARFKHGTDNFIVQTPLISPFEIDQIIKNATAGKITSKLTSDVITPVEIIEWAIESNASSLAQMDVWNKFNTRLEKAGIEKLLKEMEGNTFTIGDRIYQVLPGAGRRPRIVVRIPGDAASLVPDSQVGAQSTTVTLDENVTESEKE